jgi:hypothetical protein
VTNDCNGVKIVDDGETIRLNTHRQR